MVRTVLVYTAGLVAVYLLVAHATAAGDLLRATGTVYTGAVKTLQGR